MTVAAAFRVWTTVTAQAAHNILPRIDMADSHKDGDEGHRSLGNLEVDWFDGAPTPRGPHNLGSAGWRPRLRPGPHGLARVGCHLA